jgi:hypothetical protein
MAELTWRDGRDSILPFWDLARERSDQLQKRLGQAEQLVLAYRRYLRAADPSLPDEYAGTAWQPIEAAMPSAPF